MKREKEQQPICEELIDEMLKQGGRTSEDINGLLKQFTEAVLERALKGDMTEHLGYPKHDPSSDHSGNSRNRVTRKTLNWRLRGSRSRNPTRSQRRARAADPQEESDALDRIR